MRPSAFLSFILILAISSCVTIRVETKPDKPTTPEIQASLESLIKEFKGDVGIYAEHLETGEQIAMAADELYPTASMIKVPIMVGLFKQIDAGNMSYDSTLMWHSDLVKYSDDGIMSKFKDSSSVSLTKVISLMITYSDNLASLWCQQMAGTGTEINNWLEANGFEGTRMNSRTPGRQGDWEIYGWGQTTPREMSRLVKMIHNEEVISPWASKEMYRYLTRIYWDDEALSAVPRTVQVASKQGAVNASRSEVVLVNAPGGDYVFTVITNNQEDQSWGDDNAGFQLLRDVSQVLWDAWGE